MERVEDYRAERGKDQNREEEEGEEDRNGDEEKDESTQS